MTTSRTLAARLALPLAVAALALTACGSSAAGNESVPASAASAPAEVMESSASEPMESMESDEPMESDEMVASAAAAAPGAFITLAEYEAGADTYAEGDVVLFFNASWCSTCKEARENLQADPAAIPAGLTIVKVDYDDSDDLKRKYGVTVQHTFVQVDADGTELAKWSGSVTADEIAKQTV